MRRFLYTLLLITVTPLVLLRLWLRGRREPGYRQHISERFGDFNQPALSGAIWLHAVSVGEARAAAPIIAALSARFGERPILITCMTVTGRATATELFGDVAVIAYLPYDFPWAHRHLIQRFDPCMLLVMETEIWPNLLAGCREKNIPTLLVNARLSERSRAGYARFAPVRALIREALKSMHQIAAQSAADAQRLASLGARNVVVTGNVKFDIELNLDQVALGRRWKAQLGSRRVLLAASTRDGEEALILDAYAKLCDVAVRRQTLLVIVPRHPQRFDDVFALMVNAGLRVQRRSSLTESAAEIDTATAAVTATTTSAAIDTNTEAWLGDSMNEMFAYLAMCDVAFVGGSLVPVGGQNLIEACALGKPVLMGPSTFNFAEAADAAVAAGAMIAVNDAEQLVLSAKELLDNAERRAAMSLHALEFAAAHRGATEKTIKLISDLME